MTSTTPFDRLEAYEVAVKGFFDYTSPSERVEVINALNTRCIKSCGACIADETHIATAANSYEHFAYILNESIQLWRKKYGDVNANFERVAQLTDMKRITEDQHFLPSYPGEIYVPAEKQHLT